MVIEINVWGFYYFVIFLQVHGVIAKTNSSIIILKFDMINCKIDLLIYFGFGLTLIYLKAEKVDPMYDSTSLKATRDRATNRWSAYEIND
jgi:hypothetical protein